MGRIVAFVLAVIGAGAGYWLGGHFHQGFQTVAYISTGSHWLPHITWACLYATVLGVVVWIAALNVIRR